MSAPPGATPAGPAAAGLAALTTEAVRPELAAVDLLPAGRLVELLAGDSRRAPEAVVAAAPAITAAVELVLSRLRAGGRLLYVGAGTSGRLAVLDASELLPTFGVQSGEVEAVIAGGDVALRRPVEGAEDDRAAGAAALVELGVGASDAVIAVSASGRTPFVLGALEQAAEAGAATVAICCNESSELERIAACAVVLLVGGEPVAGSSRLNAGTAQKIALNTISTAAMIGLGKTYGNLMVDMRATSSKLRDRAARIVGAVTGVTPEEAVAALEAAGWGVKLACLVAVSRKDPAVLEPVLEQAGGRLREALALIGFEAGRS